ncbi:peptidase inhibitor family I36 protein [Streptomyces sp. NPDC055287]
MNIRNKVTAGAVSVAALGLGLIGASPASADGAGSCDTYSACLYFNSNLSGPKFGEGRGNTQYIFNYTGYFSNGYTVKNNAASVRNGDNNYTLRVYYNSNYGGPSQAFRPLASGNFNSTLKNNNASQCFDYYAVCPVN